MSVIVWPGDHEDVEFTFTSSTDISTATVQVSLGKWNVEPSTWFTPVSVQFTNGGKTATVLMRVGNGYILPSPAGVYFPWYKVTSGGVARTDQKLLRVDVRDTTGAPLGTQGPFVETINGVGPDTAGNIDVAGASTSFGGWLYGDGSDGPLVCTDGMTIQPGFYTDITIPDGVTVHVPRATFNVPIIRCSGTWTINGIVDLSGVDALNRLPAEVSAGQNAAPVNGSDVPTLFPLVGPFLGGEGGIGSSGPVTPTADGRGNFGNVVDTGVLDWIRLLSWLPSSHYDYDLSDYGFGRPGSGDGTNYGGAPGSGGRFFGLAARHLVHGPNSAYLIDGGHGAPGGDDGAGATGNGDCGGGGGGAGGWWVTLSDTITGSTTVTGTGGLGGQGCGTGTDGQPGMTGRGIHYLNRT